MNIRSKVTEPFYRMLTTTSECFMFLDMLSLFLELLFGLASNFGNITKNLAYRR